MTRNLWRAQINSARLVSFSTRSDCFEQVVWPFGQFERIARARAIKLALAIRIRPRFHAGICVSRRRTYHAVVESCVSLRAGATANPRKREKRVELGAAIIIHDIKLKYQRPEESFAWPRRPPFLRACVRARARDLDKLAYTFYIMRRGGRPWRTRDSSLDVGDGTNARPPEAAGASYTPGKVCT